MENQYKKIVNRFFELESREGFFSLKNKDGLLYWDLVRYDMLSHILEKKGILPPGSAALQTTNVPGRNFKTFCKVFPFWFYQKMARIGKNGQKDNLIQVISRNKKDGRFTDLIMADIVEEYSRNNSCFQLEIYTAFRSEVLKSARKKMFLLDIELAKCLGKLGNESFVKINETLAREFGLDCDVSAHINRHIFNYHIEYRFYSKLLQKIKPKRVFYQSLPKSLIAAARDLKIASFDVQHGHFNEFDPLYSYPETDLSHLKTTTEHFLASGGYWQQFQPGFVKTINLGSSYFYMDESRKKPHANQSVLFVSNAFIHTYMIEALDRLSVEHPQINFCYKMHSNQNGQFDATVSRFSEKKNVSVRIFNNIEENLYESDYVVLIQSTVAYQALQIGCRVVVLKKFFYEASLDLSGVDGVDFVDEISELSAILERTENVPVPAEKPPYFEPFKPEELRKL